MPRLTTSLSARLLVLTIAFVMLGEVLIYVPSVSRYRLVYLQERLAAAHEATLALEASPDGMITPELEQELLAHARVRSIALRMPTASYLMLGEPPAIDAAFDLREETAYGLIREAFITLGQTRNRVLRVVGSARVDPQILIDITLDEAPMRAEMLDYSGRILILSIVLSLITAALVYLSLQWLMVRPMRRITASLVSFREAPEDASKDLPATGRSDEIGVAQRELAELQRGLRAALRQRAHLAALGAAVGKINHDLRNILSTAALVSDRLADSDDPEVRQQTPALMAAIDRAIALCVATLQFSRAGEPELKRERVELAALVDDVGRAMTQAEEGGVAWRNDVAADFTLTADREQLFRVLFNLGQNAVEALNGAGEVRVSASRDRRSAVIEVADTGPGLTPKAEEHLFEPFAGSTREGGTGLGLPIAREIMHAHGGEIRLVKSAAGGSIFRLEFPAD
ncbi:MAG: HAMP domain-containing histidine kinase [Proteobacteria bacterium]|nr:HAMP domain-containing histidine kinase [Pseudomonadota bacterium]